MIIYPAIDLYNGCAVRLLRGEYSKMTVYSNEPETIAADFVSCGAERVHLVDLEGAKDGTTPNFDSVCKIKQSGLFCEIGGGVRSMETIERYIGAGIDRVILGTAALENEELLCRAVQKYGEKIAVGVDIRSGYVAVKGWTETSAVTDEELCGKLEKIGVKTLIVTDISKDGAMQGTNVPLYERLSSKFGMDITASGGVSSLDDVRRLAGMNLHGAIIGKAYYTGAIDLREAIRIGSADNPCERK